MHPLPPSDPLPVAGVSVAAADGLPRLLAIHRPLFARPLPASLLPLDAALATDIRDALTGIGRAPGRDAPEASAAELEARAIGAEGPRVLRERARPDR